jgi:ACT domain-containing protein
MQVICLEEPAFYALVDQVINYIKTKQEIKEDKWISAEEAMKMLHITSRTTLQKFRDEGRIRYFQTDRKIILYDRDSINAYLEKNANDTF